MASSKSDDRNSCKFVTQKWRLFCDSLIRYAWVGNERNFFSLHFAKHFALFRRLLPKKLCDEAASLSPSFFFLHISTAAKLSFMLNFISVFRSQGITFVVTFLTEQLMHDGGWKTFQREMEEKQVMKKSFPNVPEGTLGWYVLRNSGHAVRDQSSFSWVTCYRSSLCNAPCITDTDEKACTMLTASSSDQSKISSAILLVLATYGPRRTKDGRTRISSRLVPLHDAGWLEYRCLVQQAISLPRMRIGLLTHTTSTVLNWLLSSPHRQLHEITMKLV